MIFKISLDMQNYLLRYLCDTCINMLVAGSLPIQHASNDFIELGELNANSSSLSFTVSGDSVSITDGQNVAVLNFTSPQGSLSLGHAGGYLALIHN